MTSEQRVMDKHVTIISHAHRPHIMCGAAAQSTLRMRITNNNLKKLSLRTLYLGKSMSSSLVKKMLKIKKFVKKLPSKLKRRKRGRDTEHGPQCHQTAALRDSSRQQGNRIPANVETDITCAASPSNDIMT